VWFGNLRGDKTRRQDDDDDGDDGNGSHVT
jgi:hypothetical protein